MSTRLKTIGATLACCGAMLGFPAMTAPAAIISIAPPSRTDAADTGEGTVAFTRAADGLFYVVASVNDHPVRFLVDTGANTVLLTKRDAARIGLPAGETGVTGALQTAGGATAVAWTKADTIRIAGQDIGDVDIGVTETGLSVSLLGQSALAELGPMTFKNDRLIFHPRESIDSIR